MRRDRLDRDIYTKLAFGSRRGCATCDHLYIGICKLSDSAELGCTEHKVGLQVTINYKTRLASWSVTLVDLGPPLLKGFGKLIF